jgi:hypothetical protein
VLVLAALLVACVQDSSIPDSSPFRRGQWAAQFGAGSSTASFGFLKFRSPRRALVLDFRINGGHGESLVTDSSGTRFSSLFSRATVDIRLGVRQHRLGRRVIPFYSLGILGGFSHLTSVAAGFSGVDDNGWSAGVFGDVGAAYMITPNLALGATGTLTLRYASETREQSSAAGTAKVRSWDLAGDAPRATLLVQLYF